MPDASSNLDRIIPPEIKNDEFYQAIKDLAGQTDIKTILEIGSSSGEGSTEAFVSGIQTNPNNPTLFCLEVSQTRFAQLQQRYVKNPWVKCYNFSSVNVDSFPSTQEIIDFYSQNRTNLNYYPLEEVLKWLNQDIEYLKRAKISEGGIQKIKQENAIQNFDAVLIDGSEFTGRAELEEIYGARYILLDDIQTFKNYFNFHRLAKDSNYVCIAKNLENRHGYAIYKKIKKILFSVGIGPVERGFKQLTSPRFQEYANHYGFEYREITQYAPIPNHPQPHWIKIHYALQLLNELEAEDLIAWIDADVAIVRGDIELKTSKSIAFAKDSWNVINTGVWVAKVNEFSKTFFQAVFNRDDCDDHHWQDNLAVIKTIAALSEEDRDRHLEILPNCLNVTVVRGEFPQYDRYLDNPCLELIRFRHFAGGQPWFDRYFSQSIIFEGESSDRQSYLDSQSLDLDKDSNLVTDSLSQEAQVIASSPLPIHFFTIVLNGEPFIRYHINVFKELPFKWHWHIVEGVADLKHDTAWSLQLGGQICDEVHHQGRSKDGTSQYLDELAQLYPENVTLYRKPDGVFWDGKREMVNAPLPNINEECLLWQVDADELWTIEQICSGRQMFILAPEKTAAFYWCWYFVGENLVISTRNCYGATPQIEWLRTWRFKPGAAWIAHEPPKLAESLPNGQWRDIATVNPFLHQETENRGLVFQHFSYVLPEQLRFKELYYGYANAQLQWEELQKANRFPVLLNQYFSWVLDDAMVDKAESCGVVPLAQKQDNGGGWRFFKPEELPKTTHKPSSVFPKIIIDGVFFQLYKAGIARVWKALLEEWGENRFSQFLVVVDRGGTAPKIPGIKYRICPPYNSANPEQDREILQQICDQENADLFISTYYTTPISTPSVFMAYDMLPEVMGADLNHQIWQIKHHSIRQASAYITISENTAKDLIRFFPHIDPARVTVAHCGVQRNFSVASVEQVENFKAKYGISKPYFLLVSIGDGSKASVQGYKNTILFFKAFAQLSTKQGFEILCTGSGKLDSDIRTYTAGTVVHQLELSDEEMKLAYSGAIALVYPSKYEGFGLPILEAMTCGCPVITCPNASIPEVAGSAALYVNGNDIEGLANALCEIQKSTVRNPLISAGFEQCRKFSWSKMAQTMGAAFLEATLLRFELNSINLIIFPDWSLPEEILSLELSALLKTLVSHPESTSITLLIETSDRSLEEVNLILSSITMNILLEEDFELAEEPRISLLGDLSEGQWKALLPHIRARISLPNENQEKIAQLNRETLPAFDLKSFSSQRFEDRPVNEHQSPSDFATDYWQYLQRNCPHLELSELSHLANSLSATSWEEPTSALDLNNYAVVSLIQAEQSEDSSLREAYLEMALEALQKGVNLHKHPLCAAHLALVLALIGEKQQALQLTWHNLLTPIQFVYNSFSNWPAGLVYLPPGKSTLKNFKQDTLEAIVTAQDYYTQSLLLLSEALDRSQLFFYSKAGLPLLHLATQISPTDFSLKLKLIISSLLNREPNLATLLVGLEGMRQQGVGQSPILQSLFIAYRDLGQEKVANSYLELARNLSQQNSESKEWQWTHLEADSKFTYVSFDEDILLSVEPSFRSIVTSVLLAEGDWFENEMEFWRYWIQPGMTIVDVGANVGVYTFTAAKKVGPTGLVLAIEPFSGCVRCLQESCRINNMDWVKVWAGAASDRQGIARLQLYTASESNELVPETDALAMKPGTFEEVNCLTLDSLIEAHNVKQVDFLKIDAESHELSVLVGADRILREFTPVILYENIAGGKGSNLAVAEYLRSREYELFRYQPYVRKLIPISDNREMNGSLNVIAFPKSISPPTV